MEGKENSVTEPNISEKLKRHEEGALETSGIGKNVSRMCCLSSGSRFKALMEIRELGMPGLLPLPGTQP